MTRSELSLPKYMATCKQRLLSRLDALLPADGITPTRLHQAMRYSALSPGKAMRPVLVYATGEALGAELKDLDAPACAVELIHAYSLIHDDLPAMDDDDLRRGRPTCHRAFDEATAILAGDALQTLAFQALTNAPLSDKAQGQRLMLLHLLLAASGSLGMGGGQAIDLEATGKTLSLEQLETMHRMKTGALIKASVLMGAACAGLGEGPKWQALENYADAIGLAFQVHDDVLDIEGDTQTLGKPKGSDLARGKVTYPSLLGLDGAKQHAQQLLHEALGALDELPYNTRLLAEFAHYVVERGH